MRGEKNIYQQWADCHKKMLEPFLKVNQPSNMFSSFFSNSDFTNPFLKLQETGNVYKNLFDFFQNFTTSFLKPEEVYDFNKFEKLFKDFQEQYVNNVKSAFGFGNLTSHEDFFKQFTKNFGINIFGDSIYKPFMEYLKNFDFTNDKVLESILSNEEIEKYLNSPAIGLTREYIETIKQVIKNYIDYLKQMKIFEKEVTEKGKESYEEFVKEIFELIKKGETLEEFDKIFKKWVDINETIFQEYFRSEEFTDFLSKYSKTSAKLRKSLDKYTYEVLKNSNIATKTELDRAYKDIYILKKEIKTLKKLLENKEGK